MTTDQKGSGKSVLGRVLKWFLGILLAAAVVLTIIIYFFLDPIIKNRIIKGVHESSEGLYVLDINNLHARFWSGAITMEGVALRPDHRKLTELKQRDTSAYIPDVHFHFDSVNISSIRWFRYLINREKLEIGRVLIEHPSFKVSSHLSEEKNIRTGNRNFLDLLPGIIAAFTGSLRIEEIYINKGNIRYNLYGKEGVIRQKADNITVDLKKIVIDTVSVKNALYSDQALIDLRNYELHSPDGLHKLKVDRVVGKVEDSTLQLSKIYYYQKDSLYEKYPDMLEIRIDKISGGGIDYGTLLREKKIFVRSMSLHRPRVELVSSESPVGKYNAGATDSTILDDIIPYFSEAFRMDTLAVKQGAFEYKIRNREKNILQSAHSIDMYFTRVFVRSPKAKSKVYAEDIELKLKDYKYLKAGRTTLKIASVRASVRDSLLRLKNLDFESKDGGAYKVNALHIEGDGVDYMKMLRQKKADFREMRIVSPEISLDTYHPSGNRTGKGRKKPSSKPPKNFFNEALGPLADASLRAGKLIIKDAGIRYAVHKDRNLIEQEAKKASVVVYNVRVDSAAAGKYEFFDRFTVQLRDYWVKVHSENFRIDVDSAFVCSGSKSINMFDIDISQIRSFGKEQRYYFINTIENAQASGFDFNRFFTQQEVHSRKLDINRMNLEIFLDAGKVVRPEYASKMPQELIQSLPFYLRIDTIKVNNSNIVYTDQEPKINEPGKLTFERTDMLTYNFNNDSTLMTEGTPAVMTGKTYLMGQGLLKFRISIPLLSKDFDAYYSGSIDTMNGEKFNSVLSFVGIKVESGRILPGEFGVEVNKGSAIGKLRFEYENLHIKVINPETQKSSKIKSVVGNVVVKNSNPPKGEDTPETVSICGRRVPDDSFFYFIWRVLKDGIVETITKDTLYDVVKQ